MDGDARLRTWERRTNTGLMLLAAAFLVGYAVPVLWEDMPARWETACHVANVVIWGCFAVDYAVRFGLARRRREFVRTHLFDLAVLLLPVLRPLRLLRLLTALTVIERGAERLTRGKLAVYVGATTGLLVFVGALAVLDAERREGNIQSFGEALWWSVVTVTTVGYGDHFPVTGAGRAVALGLMVCGIGLLGFVTGSLVSWVLERISSVEERGEEARADLADVLAELRALRAEVAALRGTPATGAPPPRAEPGAGPQVSSGG